MCKKRKERRQRTQKEINIIGTIGCILGLLGFVAIAIPAILSDEQGHYENGWIFFVLFLVLMISSVAVLLSVIPDQLELDVKKLSKSPLSVLSNVGKANVLHTFQEHKFEGVFDDFYKRKTVDPLKGTLYYYLVFVNAEDIDAACNSVCNRFLSWLEFKAEKPTYSCLLTFLYKDEITEEDKQKLKEQSASTIVGESELVGQKYFSQLPILVETSTGKGVYLAKDKGLTIFAHGCRLLKKYLQ